MDSASPHDDNSDLNRIINSDEIQSIVLAPKDGRTIRPLKKNPLKNLGAMLKLNPYAQTARRMALMAEAKHKAEKSKKVAASRKTKAVRESGKKFYKALMVDSEYKGQDYDNFGSWLHKA